jgi:hypothetical protein
VLQIGYALEPRRIAIELEHRPKPEATTKPVARGLHAKGT